MLLKHTEGKQTKLYNTWRGMKERCTNPNHKNFNLYAGKLCAAWHDSSKFVEWAESSVYFEGASIDRIDRTKGYSPDNCQWITKQEDSAKGNKERRLTCILYENNYYTLTELRDFLGVSYGAMDYRIKTFPDKYKKIH